MKTNRRFLLTAIFGLALTFTFSCSGGDDNNDGGGGNSGSGGGCVEFNGNNKCNDISNCKTKQIGEQVWMVENLNYDVPGSVCYQNNDSNCDKYGRLYDWATAMALPDSCNKVSSCNSQISEKHRGICPAGWHIPNDEDWYTLMKFINSSCSETVCVGAGTKLKAKSGWGSRNEGKLSNGTDDYGFSALPGGTNVNGNLFLHICSSSDWWSSSVPYYLVHVWYIGHDGKMGYESENVHLDSQPKSYMNSIRCVKD